MRRPQDEESGPVERRAVPRAPALDLIIEGVDPPLAGVRLDVSEVGLDSFFLHGDAAELLAVGQVYRVLFRYGDRAVRTVARCVRRETAPRKGIAFRLAPEEQNARALLAEVLKPAAVPRDSD